MPITLGGKDLSETIRNYVTIASVVIGGGWVLYQWDTLFPKTRADVSTAAAKIRTDVKATALVSLDRGEGDHSPEDGEVPKACDTETRRFLVSGNLGVESASAIPIRATVASVEVLAGDTPTMGIVPATADAITPLEMRPVATIPGETAFLGGLSTNRVEQGQTIASSFIWTFEMQFPCTGPEGGLGQEKLVVFRFNLDLEAINPASGATIDGADARKVALSVCQVTARAHANCNLEDLQAFGQ